MKGQNLLKESLSGRKLKLNAWAWIIIGIVVVAVWVALPDLPVGPIKTGTEGAGLFACRLVMGIFSIIVGVIRLRRIGIATASQAYTCATHNPPPKINTLRFNRTVTFNITSLYFYSRS